MRLLLDTLVVIWWDQGGKLSPAAARAIESADEVFVSAASFWEISIKASLGRIKTDRPFEAVLAENGFVELPVLVRHVSRVAALPLHHRDPFDRLLVCQAAADRLTLVTRDRALAPYRVPTIAA